MSLTGDALTDWLVPLASQLAGAVKEFDKPAVAAVLSEVRAKGALEGLVVVLAAMVPDDLTGTELLAWMRNPDEYVRLRNHGVGSFAASRLCSYT